MHNPQKSQGEKKNIFVPSPQSGWLPPLNPFQCPFDMTSTPLYPTPTLKFPFHLKFFPQPIYNMTFDTATFGLALVSRGHATYRPPQSHEPRALYHGNYHNIIKIIINSILLFSPLTTLNPNDKINQTILWQPILVVPLFNLIISQCMSFF